MIKTESESAASRLVQVEGSYFYADSSERQSAVLNVTETGQVSVLPFNNNTETGRSLYPFSQLEISPRLGNTPRHISFKDGSRFETVHNDKIDELLVSFRQAAAYRFIHLLESHSLIVLLVVVLVSGFIWGSVKYGVPAVANFSAKILPVDVSRYLGQGTLDILDKTVFASSELDLQRKNQLTRLFEGYASDYPELQISFDFRRGENIGANAMALPGGQIIFTDELVELAQNDQELLAIAGHEIGHLYHRHMLRRVIQDSMLTVLLVLMTGDVSSASSIVITIPALLLELAYSREFESEADDFAYDFLMENNIETEHFANIMTRLMNYHREVEQAEQGSLNDMDKTDESDDFVKQINPYLSTHPATDERVKRFLVN